MYFGDLMSGLSYGLNMKTETKSSTAIVCIDSWHSLINWHIK